MGLDMFAFSCRPDQLNGKEVDFEVDDPDELFYWRKHPNLHGWMEKLYRKKGGMSAEFNLVPVKLDDEDLDRLEKVVTNGKLPSTSGFFFGHSEPSRQQEDLEFISKARKLLKEGYAVYYNSWW